MSDQLFSEAQVGEIMIRAAALQESGSENGYTPGVSSGELAKIAQEMGIDEKYLNLAILEKSTIKNSSSKVELYPDIERVYPIHIEPENFDVITEYVKPLAVAGTTGQAGFTHIGKTLEGQVSGTWGNPHVKVTSRDGRTKVYVRSDRGTPIGITTLWLLPLIFSIAAFKFSVIAGLIAIATCFALAFWTYKKLAQLSSRTTYEAAQSIEKAILEYGANQQSNINEAAAPLSIDQPQTQSLNPID